MVLDVCGCGCMGLCLWGWVGVVSGGVGSAYLRHCMVGVTLVLIQEPSACHIVVQGMVHASLAMNALGSQPVMQSCTGVQLVWWAGRQGETVFMPWVSQTAVRFVHYCL